MMIHATVLAHLQCSYTVCSNESTHPLLHPHSCVHIRCMTEFHYFQTTEILYYKLGAADT